MVCYTYTKDPEFGVYISAWVPQLQFIFFGKKTLILLLLKQIYLFQNGYKFVDKYRRMLIADPKVNPAKRREMREALEKQRRQFEQISRSVSESMRERSDVLKQAQVDEFVAQQDSQTMQFANGIRPVNKFIPLLSDSSTDSFPAPETSKSRRQKVDQYCSRRKNLDAVPKPV